MSRMRESGLATIGVVLCAAALWAAPAQAGCGCQKAPPNLAAVRPNASYPGTPLTLFNSSFQIGQVYSVDFIPSTGTSPVTVSATVVSRRDIADAVVKPQLVVTVPNLPLGPTAIRVRGTAGTLMFITDDAFTVAPLPIAVAQQVGTRTYPGFKAAIGRDGTFYISLDMSAVRLPRVFRAQAKGYPLTFTSNDVTFYNIQGFLMQLLTASMPGLYSVVSSTSSTDSDILGYSRHEFNTFYLQHEERQVHEVLDGNWHVDGTRHVDHDHLILAIGGVMHNGSMPVAGATPAFTLSFETQSLFDHAFTVTGDATFSGSGGADAYAAQTNTFGLGGDVVTNGKLSMSNSATINGDATAGLFSMSGSSRVTGLRSAPIPPVVLMDVKMPDLLPDLGTLNVGSSLRTVTGPGSFRVNNIAVGNGGRLFINNSAGPVTLYVTGQVQVNGGVIEVANPNPEWFAIYLTTNQSVSLDGGGANTAFRGVIYAPKSKLSMSAGQFFGSFVGASMQASGSAQFHYPLALREVPMPPPTSGGSGGSSGPCTPVDLDFEGFAAGTIINEQYAALGVHISANNNSADGPNLAAIFDSAHPTGGDPDLASPNQSFGGPGIGTGGAVGQPGENRQALGNVLIIQENGADLNGDGIVDAEPDDEVAGGVLTFRFDTPVTVVDVQLLDMDFTDPGTLVARDALGHVIVSKAITQLGDNSFQTAAMNATGVSTLEVNLTGCGAVPRVRICRP